jgi:hypothetical protein
MRGQPESLGHPVIAIRPGDFAKQIENYPDAFGVLEELAAV